MFVHGQTVTIVMEYLAGSDLYRYLKKHGALGEEQMRVVLKQLVEALVFCHYKQVVHRDIKPANIMVLGDELENVKIIDFGIASMSFGGVRGQREGTLKFMAPEMLEGC